MRANSDHSIENTEILCDCGSTRVASECCELIHNGKKKPTSPEELMRSRYLAFKKENENYLLKTWHNKTKPAEISFDKETAWVGLNITKAELDKVSFVASYLESGILFEHHEESVFINTDDTWYYDTALSLEVKKAEKQPSKASPCLCGSGKKFKRCHLNK